MLTGLVNLFRPPPDAAVISDAAEARDRYRYWRVRILYSTLIGYALFYFVRKNLSLAMPLMEAELGFKKADLGLFLTLHGVVYGFSKFANGFLGDRANPRYFMAAGLVCSAAMNICFGLSSAAVTFGVFWLVNGWFQGMGFPPCARSLTHWFSPRERATSFGIWNTSHSIGTVLVLLLCTYLIRFNWRLCFFVPAGLAILGTVFVVDRLRDRPRSLGLPAVDEHAAEPAAEDNREPAPGAFRRFVIHQVFLNPLMWVVSLANFFVYTIRYAILDWGPTFLPAMKGIRLEHAGWTVAAYEFAGMLGMLAAGWMTDRLFKGRAGRACVVYMLLCSAGVVLFWTCPVRWPWVYTAMLCAVGFFIYGPQCLVGVIAANLATSRAAATAIGLTGVFGYLSGVLSGWGLGYMVDRYGNWDPVFIVLIAAGIAASLLFALTWNARYKQAPADSGESNP